MRARISLVTQPEDIAYCLYGHSLLQTAGNPGISIWKVHTFPKFQQENKLHTNNGTIHMNSS